MNSIYDPWDVENVLHLFSFQTPIFSLLSIPKTI